jgi:RNA polymerase sigma factor (sigma-70 family)
MEDRPRRLDAASQDLVSANLGLAGWFAHRYRGCGIEPEELYSLACLGLCRAALAWQPGRGCKFGTFASTAIVQDILNELKHRHRKCRWRADYHAPLNPEAPGLAVRDPEPIDIETEALWAAIRRLPAREQAVITARLEGRLHREIALDVGLGKNRVGLIEQRARTLLRERLA